jgi:nucleotide-binding universal stress UspA family protein
MICAAMAQTASSRHGSRAPSTVAEGVERARQPEAATAGLANGGPRVLVLYERGACGRRAIDQARELIQAREAQLTVVTVAPRDTRVRGTGVSARDFNDAVRDSAQRELDEARRLLGSLAERIVFEVVFDGGDTSLAAWVAARAFDIILLPARRRLFSRGAHPAAATLRGSTAADVRVIGT